MRNELKKVEECLLIRLDIENNFESFDIKQLDELTKMCIRKSIVVFFTSRSRESSLIFWKSSIIDYLLTLKRPLKKSAFEMKELYGFIADFLIFYISQGHLGKHIKGSFTYYVRFLGGVGGGVCDFVTIQTRKKFFLGKFVTRGRGGLKFRFFA